MKSKESLVLLEQLAMVLLFALAAAVCLGCFVKADSLSNSLLYRQEAVIIAQNTAEQIKAGHQPEEDQAGYRVVTQPVESDVPGLGKTKITVFREENALFSLTVGYQEELP